MKSMRTISLVAVAALVFVFTAAPLSAASKAPVKLGQKVTIKGTKDVSSKSSASVEEELDDKYFNPTFIKAKAGEKITFTVKNEGKLPHTFTSDDLSIDKQVDPGKSTKFTADGPERRRGVPVPLPVPRGQRHDRRGVHQGRRECYLDRDEQLVGLR